VLNGTSTTIAVNAATNQLTNSNYDLNGNMLMGVGATFTYDEANRVETATEVSGGTEYFGYSPDNKLVYRNTAAGVEEITFYGAYGEKLWNSSTGSYLWFAGRLIADGNSAVFQDRVGTNRSNGQHNFSYPYTCFYGIACGARYYPYGMRSLRRRTSGLSSGRITGIRLREWIMRISDGMPALMGDS
jgi:hypothetical protein